MIDDPLEVEVQLESVALEDLKVLLERLVRWDLLELVVELEHVMKNMTGEALVVVSKVHKVVQVREVVKEPLVKLYPKEINVIGVLQQ